jgi:hypothetical protein
MEILQQENTKLQEENARLKITIQELETRLKKYINNEAHKKYYENHKQEIKQQQSKYIEKLREENPDKMKEYWKRAYQKRKEKKLQQQENTQDKN